jgi:hypothetical protein
VGVNSVNNFEEISCPKIGGAGSESIPPDPERTKGAFSRIGYSFDEAIADLIDNSVDAGATDVLVRLLHDKKSVRRVCIVDNGRGMREETLRRAMQFGSTLKHRQSDLGKYGIGLKSASLSQCEQFAVVTRSGGEVSGRRWAATSFSHGWLCEKLDRPGCARLLEGRWAGLNLGKSGAIVMWDDLTCLQAGDLGVSETVNRAIVGLANHLGLVYHRFLESKGRLRIHLDSQVVGTPEFDIAQLVSPLNPFAYDAPGAVGYPKQFRTVVSGIGEMTLIAHIWPPKSRKAGYTLGGGRVSSRQGFYFYRNDRLIQAGGWNGWRGDDAEPHLSLARVAVDVPAGSEQHFDVVVQKSRVSPPRDFIEAISKARAGSETFADYVARAIKVYRLEGKGERQDERALVPWRGLPANMRQTAREILAPEGGIRHLNFIWKKLDAGALFELDLTRKLIYLNEVHRRAVLGRGRKSQNDARLFKMSLFMMVRGCFDGKPVTKARAELLATCNRLLLGSLKA